MSLTRKRSILTAFGRKLLNFAMTNGLSITSIALISTLTLRFAKPCSITSLPLSLRHTNQPIFIHTQKLFFVFLITLTALNEPFFRAPTPLSDFSLRTISIASWTRIVLIERIGRFLLLLERYLPFSFFPCSASALLSYSNLSMTSKIPLEYIIIEVMLGELFNLPKMAHPEICYGSILLDLCKLQPSTFPQAVSLPFIIYIVQSVTD